MPAPGKLRDQNNNYANRSQDYKSIPGYIKFACTVENCNSKLNIHSTWFWNLYIMFPTFKLVCEY
jgi:hypothetical protein